MQTPIDKNIKTESEFLKQASIYVGRSEIENAISILEEARLLLPVTNRVLKALGKLYLSIGKPALAAECFQIVLNRRPEVDSEPYDQLPIAIDIQYLAEQSHKLNEKEYSIEPTLDVDARSKEREILSAGTKQSIRDGNISFAKSASDEDRQQLVETHFEDLEDDQPPDDIPQIVNLEVEINDVSQVTAEDIHAFDSLEEARNEDAEDSEEMEPDSYPLDNYEPLDLGLSIDDLVDDEIDELFGLSETLANPDSLRDSFDVASNPDCILDIYDDWIDEPQDELEEGVESWILSDQISKEERAKQAAIECLENMEWDKNKLTFLMNVFIEFGWSNARKAVEREALAGASYEELYLAFKIKQAWNECERYWISFSGAWIPGESTSATYMHCSWKQALRLIRVFNDLPDLDEVWDLVEGEFDYWYGDRVLRSRFPAFSKYLFSYRFNDSLPTLPVNEIRRFDVDVSFDEMDAPWSYHSRSAEVRFLSEHGIDVINRYAPKSYYASDVIFDPRDLNVPSSKRNSVGTIFDDENT